MIKKIFQIPDMTCPNCAMKIESLEDDLEGIARVDASYRALQAAVEYDETKVSEEQIIAALKEKGYTALVVETRH
jgi:copper chaperone CopZ